MTLKLSAFALTLLLAGAAAAQTGVVKAR